MKFGAYVPHVSVTWQLQWHTYIATSDSALFAVVCLFTKLQFIF